MASLNALAHSSTESLDVIAISETWFTDESCPHLAGYHCHATNRSWQGGGVALFVKDGLESFEVECTALLCTDVEQTWCCIKAGQDKILFGCIYRPPPKPADKPDARQMLELGLLKSVKAAREAVTNNQYEGLCIAGDFNFNKTK
jgi:hypothetical protein